MAENERFQQTSGDTVGESGIWNGDVSKEMTEAYLNKSESPHGNSR